MLTLRERDRPGAGRREGRWTDGRAGNSYRYCDVLAEVGGPVRTPARDTLPWIRSCLRAHHQRQAQCDIRELVRAGRLTVKGEAQGRHCAADPDPPEEITRGVREPRPLRDPYA
ncbi:hypothetical protein [Streptomyces sp. CBMA156]|uniref:hypothetical protein n=1 Tax=Streptomyces sp. CBMA156 TaxID=1930280 RepID=UPI0016619238|nr:hypothetical protein [Streptomyces sp. CBMA156]